MCIMYMVQVDDSKCIGCGACASDCPQNCYEMDGGISVVNDNECVGCQTCIMVCPNEAITLNEY